MKVIFKSSDAPLLTRNSF